MEETTRPCPFCNETIQTAAIKCRWCGELLPEAAPQATVDKPAPISYPKPDGPKHPEGASTILILGILGLVFCFILGIVAWVKGREYETQCRELGLRPEGNAVAGKVLGMIATCLAMIPILFIILAVAIPSFAFHLTH